jgi:hypothetical protein
MHAWTLVIVLGVTFGGGQILSADEPPHLRLVYALRERGDHDLALEYLQRLQEREAPALPEEIKAVLPVEIAKSQVDAAGRSADPAAREAAIRQAVEDIQAFVKDQAQARHASLGDAHLTLARIFMEQGRAKAVEAEHQQGQGEPMALRQEAIELLGQANESFAKAAEVLEERLRALNPMADKAGDEWQRIFRAYLETLYYHGWMLYQKSDLHGNDVEGSKALEQAAKKFETLAGHRERHPLGWQGFAWYGRCHEALQKNLAEKAYKFILADKRPEVVPAQRLVRYFQLLTAWRSLATKGERNKIRAEVENWVSAYPSAQHTPEGRHVRYLLSLIYRDELEEASKTNPAQINRPEYQKLVDQTLGLLAALEKSPGEYATVATEVKYQVLRLSRRATGKAVHELKTFAESLLRANLELDDALAAEQKLQEAKDEKQRGELRSRMTAHIQTMLAAVRRGLALMPDDIKDDDRDRLYRLLYIGYLYTGDSYRAAIAIEHLARNARKPETARTAAVAAVDLYQTLARQSRQPADVQRLIAMATWLEQKWPDEGVTDTARRSLGFAFAEQQKYREAAAMWERVSPKHPAYAECSYRAGALYWNLHVTESRKSEQAVDRSTPERTKAVALLTRSLQATESPAEADKTDRDVQTPIQAKILLAEIYSILGQLDAALELAEPLVQALGQGKLPEQLPASARTRILAVALGAHVQKNSQENLDRAMVILGILQQQASPEDLGGSLRDQLNKMGSQLKSQLTALEQQGPAAQRRLEQARASLRKFLSQLEVQLDRDAKLPVDLRVWVGTSYASMGEHFKAAKVFASIPNPGKHGDPKLVQLYRQCQLLRIRALREGAAAEREPGKRSLLFVEVEKALQELVQRADWAKKHPQVVTEQILLLQDQEKYSGRDGAIVRWDALRKALEPHIDQRPDLKDLYHEANYHLVYCMYMEVRRLPSSARREKEKALSRIAQLLLQLQMRDYGGAEHRGRFEELLNHPDHQDLKQHVERLQKASSR